jgi:hypothetical protein
VVEKEILERLAKGGIVGNPLVQVEIGFALGPLVEDDPLSRRAEGSGLPT